MNLIRILPLLLLVLAVGCSGAKHSKADVERGLNAMTAALDSWKNSEPPGQIRARPDPVEFTDELKTTHKLLSYTLGEPNATDPGVIRYPATLQLQDRKGKTEERRVVFEVKLGPPIVIARDPYE